MGDYPFASGYIIHGNGLLPPYPMRVACAALSDSSLAKNDTALMDGMRAALDIYYNYTHTEPCFSPFGGQGQEANLKQAVHVSASGRGSVSAGESASVSVDTSASESRSVSASARTSATASVRASGLPRLRMGASPQILLHPARRSAAGASTAACAGDWGYQYCTEMVQPFTQGTAEVSGFRRLRAERL